MEELLQKYANNEFEIEKLEKEMTEAICKLKSTQAILKETNEAIKEQIMNSMENNEIKKYENDFISITYVAPTIKKTIDTSKLKEEYNEIYNKCLKTSNVKASLRIKVKNQPREKSEDPIKELVI